MRVNLTTIRRLRFSAKKYLGLEERLPPLGAYPLKDKVGVGLASMALRMSLIKGIHAGHLKWYITQKGTTSWNNLYGGGFLGMVDTIYARDRRILPQHCVQQGGRVLGIL